MPEIRINIDGLDNDKRFSQLEKLVREKQKNSDLGEIRKLIAKVPKSDTSVLERRLGRIEGLLKEIVSINQSNTKSITRKIDGIDIPENQNVDRLLGRHTSQIISALSRIKPAASKVNLNPIKEHLEDMESALMRKLSRLSLPKTIVVNDTRPQIVPYIA